MHGVCNSAVYTAFPSHPRNAASFVQAFALGIFPQIHSITTCLSTPTASATDCTVCPCFEINPASEHSASFHLWEEAYSFCICFLPPSPGFLCAGCGNIRRGFWLRQQPYSSVYVASFKEDLSAIISSTAALNLCSAPAGSRWPLITILTYRLVTPNLRAS